jgi:hypothetical protein
MRAGPILAIAVLASCKFTPQATGDAAPPDAGACLSAPSSECADDLTLRECITVNEQPIDTNCPWGCVTGNSDSHCGIVRPYGGGAMPDDTDPDNFDGLEPVVLSGATIDGTAGTISGVPDSGFDYIPRAGNTIGVFRFKRLTIDGTVKLVGTRAIVLLSDGPIVVSGLLDAKGPCTFDDAAIEPGPGGFKGGKENIDSGLGPGGGRVGTAQAGAGGGGHGGAGGDGGSIPLGASGGLGGVVNGTATIDILVGGSGGGATAGGGGHARGGGGGGAIQLISNVRITLAPGGAIDAGGCGGDSGAGGSTDGGGGGGAGGAILLEAPVIDGPGTLAVNGGGGGAGDDSEMKETRPTGYGEAGRLDRAAAAGAIGSATGAGGGRGAAAATYTGEIGAPSALHAGGGGGAVGRIRLNTRLGTVAATGEMSPGLDDEDSTCTAGFARVE